MSDPFQSTFMTSKIFNAISLELNNQLKHNMSIKNSMKYAGGKHSAFLRLFYEQGLCVAGNLSSESKRHLPEVYTEWCIEKHLSGLVRFSIRFLDANFLWIARHNSNGDIDGWIFAHKHEETIIAITHMLPATPYVFTKMHGFDGNGEEHFISFVNKGYHPILSDLMKY